MEVLGSQPTLMDQRLISIATKATSFMENHGECVNMMDNGVENTQSANVRLSLMVANTAKN